MGVPLRSMTGFARVRCALGDGELMVSVKSVNHRGLDLVIQSSAALDPFESGIRALVKSQVLRGHVEVRVSLPKRGADGSALELNRGLLRAYLHTFRQEAEAHNLDSKPDLNAALPIPGLFPQPQNPAPRH